jgi:hypothetical protein
VGIGVGRFGLSVICRYFRLVAASRGLATTVAGSEIFPHFAKRRQANQAYLVSKAERKSAECLRQGVYEGHRSSSAEWSSAAAQWVRSRAKLTPLCPRRPLHL